MPALRPSAPLSSAGTLAALGYVLATAIDRETACACIAATEAPVVLCPSGPHRLLAAAAACSPSLWRRCARLVESSLGPARHLFEDVPADDLLELIESGGAEALEARELASLVWSLLLRREPAAESIVRRLEGRSARAA